MRGYITRYFFSLLVLFAVESADSSANNNPRFERIVTAEGISTGTIHQIYQDKIGFIWLATGNGLVRYDGYSFKTYSYDPDNPNSISGNDVRCIVEDIHGNLWIGTLGYGLNYFIRNEERFIRYRHDPSDPAGLPWDEIVSIVLDSQGDLWVGFWSKGLGKFDTAAKTFTLYAAGDGMPVNLSIYSVIEDKRGDIWIGTRRGVYRFDRTMNTFTHYHRDANGDAIIYGEEVFTLFQDSHGMIWIATEAGMNVYNPSTDNIALFTKKDSEGINRSPGRVRSIAEDHSGNIWFGSDGGGLYVYYREAERISVFRHNRNISNSLATDAIWAVAVDRSGILWIGTIARGLLKYNPDRIKFHHIHNYHDEQGERPIGVVNSIIEDKDGFIWIGTNGNGVLRYDPGTGFARRFTGRIDDPHSLSDNSVWSLYEHPDGTLWVGTFSGGLNILDPATGFVTLYSPDQDESYSIPESSIVSIVSDSKNNIWLATGGSGVLRTPSDRIQFNQFNPESTPPMRATHISRVFEDRTGDIWIGSWGMGLKRYNYGENEFSDIMLDPDNPTPITTNIIVSLAQDANEIIWAGTWGSGLFMIDKMAGTVRRFTTADGLPHNNVYGIVIDEMDYVWISTGNGLARYSPSSDRWISYSEENGLQSPEFSNGAYHRGRSGRIYFGGVDGFNMFYPEDVQENSFIPPVVITSLRVYGEEVDPTRMNINSSGLPEIILNYREQSLSFEFSSLDYSDPKNNLYAYVIEGIDNEWSYTGNRRFINYSNLRPGKYTLRVKASNSEGVWNEEGVSLSIVMLPPFWQRWWFRILAASGIVGLLVVAYNYRVEKLLEIERTRYRIARDLHDDVGGTLSSIGNFISAIQSDVNATFAESTQKFLSLIGESSYEAQEAINDIIWSIDPAHESLDAFFAKCRRYTFDMCESKSIRHRIQFPELPPGKSIPLASRRSLWLIYKEIITNAVKHSKCTELHIELSLSARLLELKIRDNGNGFNPDTLTDRYGLKNIHARAGEIHASINMKTSPGNGTHWHISVPL